MTDQNTAPNLEALERDIADPKPHAAVTAFAPPRVRQLQLPNGEMEAIQTGLRKVSADISELHQRLLTFADMVKLTGETLQRSLG